MVRSCLAVVVLGALAATVASTPLLGPAAGVFPQSTRPTRPLFDRTQRGPLDLADPIRPRAHSLRRKTTPAGRDLADGDPNMLPTALRPTDYKIRLAPHLSGDFSFDGSIEIDFNAIEATDKIVLHSKELTFNKSNCMVLSDVGPDLVFFANVTDIQFDESTEFATFTLTKPLKAGWRFALQISEFTGKLNEDMEGFYRSSYKTSDGKTTWLAVTQFEATGARRAFPCFDEPQYKARFEITIYHDPSLTAISNMPVDSLQPSRDGEETRTVFTPSLPMSTYLVAFIVSDFDKLSDEENHFQTWARKDIVKGGTFSQEVGPKALKLLSEFNGIDYQLPKMDQAAIPDFLADATENWGLVTYKESFLIETAETTTSMRESIATTICNQLGHQWTGDLVTLDWWSHTWLNEGFASFYENMICKEIEPDWNLEDKMLPTFYHIAMESDVRETQVAMSSPASGSAQIEDHFGVISSDKGASVLRMFYYVLTPDVFKKGMKRYLNDYMFKNTNPEHLFKAMNAEIALSKLHQIPSGVTFSDVASTWTEQPGVPLLTVTRNYTSGRVYFNQERFLYVPAKNESLVDQQWYIPLVMTSEASPDFDTSLPQGWLDPNVTTSSLPTRASEKQWVLVNPKQTGYFRVNYDEANWKLLSAAMASDSSIFPASTRAQLLNDALALALAGKLDYKLALPFLGAFRAERSVASWQTAVTAIKYLWARLANTDADSGFMQLLRYITSESYDSVGYTLTAADTHEVAYLRTYMTSYACFAGNAECLADAASALEAWLEDSSKMLQPDTAATTLCFGIRGSDATTFEAMKNKWQNEVDSNTRDKYASSLACSGDEKTLTALLSDAVGGIYSFSDGEALFNAIFDLRENHRVLMEFTRQHADDIRKVFGNLFDVQVLDALIRDIRTRQELIEVRTWVEAKYKGQAGWAKLEAAFSATEAELRGWFDKYYDSVAGYLAMVPTESPYTRRPTSRPTSRPNSRPTSGPTRGPPGDSTTPSHDTTTPSAAVMSTSNFALLSIAMLTAALCL